MGTTPICLWVRDWVTFRTVIIASKSAQITFESEAESHWNSEIILSTWKICRYDIRNFKNYLLKSINENFETYQMLRRVTEALIAHFWKIDNLIGWNHNHIQDPKSLQWLKLFTSQVNQLAFSKWHGIKYVRKYCYGQFLFLVRIKENVLRLLSFLLLPICRFLQLLEEIPMKIWVAGKRFCLT